MGILDTLMKNPEMIGNVAKFASENPEIAKAALSLLSSGEGTVGGSGGLAGVVGALQSNGLGDAVASWLGNGKNQAVSPQKIESALGSDTLASFADKAGVTGSEASTLLAGMLPQLIDKLSPDGKLPDSRGLESMLGGLLGNLGGNR